MYNSFSVRDVQTFWELSMSLSNMFRAISNIYTHPFQPQLMI